MWHIQSTWIGAYRVFITKPQGNRPLGRPRHRWRENTKMGLKKAVWEGDWINLAQDREVPSSEYSKELLGSIIYREF